MPHTAQELERDLQRFKTHYPEPQSELEQRCVLAYEATIELVRQLEAVNSHKATASVSFPGTPFAVPLGIDASRISEIVGYQM